MKKFFGSLYVFFAVILVSLVAVPWNDFSVWGLTIDFLSTLTEYEFYIKLGILGFIFVFGFMGLLITNHHFKKNGKVAKVSSIAASSLFILYGVSFLAYLSYLIYTDAELQTLGIGISNERSIMLIASAGLLVFALIFSHLFIKSFRLVGNLGRFAFFFLFFLFAAISAGAAFYYYEYYAVDYANMSAKYMVVYVPVVLVFYLIHVIILKRKSKPVKEEFETDEDFQELDEIILTDNHEIVTKSQKVNLNEEVYQEVKVDPEFAKQNKLRSKPNSIEYYIEKPKMFKPLNPTFDKLVDHIRELPDVIAKVEEEKITFYVARRPFMVLMNYGDYYRMAFRYELEEGIRLIIKYPTISKNKSTRDELWFKANNYGDLPKEVIYKIVKDSYNVVTN